MSSQVEIIKKVGPIQVGQTYLMTEGNFAGQTILVEWINPDKQIHIGNNIMCRQIYGKVIGTRKKINYILEFLVEYQELKRKLKWKNMSDFDLIMLTKRRNKDAIREFIRRFKKMPKINGK